MNIGMTFSLIPLPTPQILPARRYASAGTSYGPVSVTSWSSIETVERIWNFVPNSGLRNRNGISTVETS